MAAPPWPVQALDRPQELKASADSRSDTNAPARRSRSGRSNSVQNASFYFHNIIYFVIFVQGSEIGLWTAVFRFGLFSTIYTIAFAVLPMFVYSRKIAQGSTL